MAVGPRSGEPGISCPTASSPASNFDRRAGWSPHDARSWSTTGSRASSHSGLTSTSTRRSCMGRWPPPTTIMVSSSATSAASTPPTRSANGRRRVRTWSTSRNRREPTMARSRRPTAPSVPSAATPADGQDLGHLETLAQTVPLGRARSMANSFRYNLLFQKDFPAFAARLPIAPTRPDLCANLSKASCMAPIL